ncbi:glycerophosphodiester phosphodiesterase family protein [Brevibacillus sp. TJ4]|uniref:glycerophosphodiester phosphodiesterase family protein n=1 Tax=Brevibacillus sp. TJ4 TaxID=3234853 RepID=UPI0037D2891A
MKARKRPGRVITYVILLVAAFVYLNNTSLLSTPPENGPLLLAHRGVAQTFSMEGITNETCTAEQMFPPEHPYLENTIPSMEAAFQAGADIVELDVHLTKDDQFAVFHDWTLDCRTDGSGVTREHTMDELKQLDIGYGYTADGGQTFPFRGKGVGMMPTLDEVLDQFPEQSLLIHVKSNDPLEGEKLAERFASLPENRLSRIAVYGGDEPIAALKQAIPQMRVMSMETMKSCLIPYIAVGWTGHVPDACANTQLHIPEKIAPWLWGYPSVFLNRMEDAGTRVVLVAGGGKFSEGFDQVEDLQRLPDAYTGVIWTNRIDRIGPLFQQGNET